MKVIACLPIKGRLPLLAFTITRLLIKNGCSQVICAGDTIEEERVVRDNGGIFVYHINSPLGSKWNSAFVRVREFNPDACLFMGSSDWVSDNWIPYMGKYLDEYDMVGKPDFNMAHFRGNREGDRDIQMGTWGGYNEQSGRHGEAIGIGRMLRREILERIEYRPFDPTLDNSMDYSMHVKVLSLKGKIKSITTNETQSLSISCDEWTNKHNFLREMSYSTSKPITNPEEWLYRWGFYEEAFEFLITKRG